MLYRRTYQVFSKISFKYCSYAYLFYLQIFSQYEQTVFHVEVLSMCSGSKSKKMDMKWRQHRDRQQELVSFLFRYPLVFLACPFVRKHINRSNRRILHRSCWRHGLGVGEVNWAAAFCNSIWDTEERYEQVQWVFKYLNISLWHCTWALQDLCWNGDLASNILGLTPNRLWPTHKQ